MLKQGWTIANMVATPNFVVFVMNPNAIRRQPARKSAKKHDRSKVDSWYLWRGVALVRFFRFLLYFNG